MFAVGFSLPLGAILYGLSLSRTLFIAKNAEKIVRWVAGMILLIVGFYFLLTF
jgi:cytochrome c biogenesis protein CcdA